VRAAVTGRDVDDRAEPHLVVDTAAGDPVAVIEAALDVGGR